jgi:hypothetical protein
VGDMSQETSAPEPDNRKLTSPLANLFDLVLTGVFWVYMTNVAYGHTPDFSEKWKWIMAGYTSTCVSGVFWLGINGLRVTLVDQIRRKKAGIQS